MAEPTKKELQEKNQTMRQNMAEMSKLLQNMSYLVSRQTVSSKLGQTFGGERELYSILGYKLNPSYEDFHNHFMRDGIAHRVCTDPPEQTWREHPILVEGENKAVDEMDTPGSLQRQFEELADKLDLWAKLEEVDTALAYSRFSILYLGLPGQPDQETMKSKKVAYAIVGDEGNTEVKKFYDKPDDEKFGLPAEYSIKLDDEVAQEEISVHPSRVIHFVSDWSDTRAYSVPRLMTMINRFEDLEKVVGSGSEAFYQLILRGMAILAKDDYTLPAPGSDEYKKMEDEIDEWYYGFRRFIRLQGVDLENLGAQPVDSKQQFEVIVSYLAGTSNIPQRRLLGSERGELASSQDEANYFGYIDTRRKNFAEPYILRKVVNRFGELGLLTVPKKYTVVWPELFQLNELEKAELAGKVATAVYTITGGASDTAIPIDEFMKIYLDYVAKDPSKLQPQGEPVPQPGDQPQDQTTPPDKQQDKTKPTQQKPETNQ